MKAYLKQCDRCGFEERCAAVEGWGAGSISSIAISIARPNGAGLNSTPDLCEDCYDAVHSAMVVALMADRS